MLIGIIVAAMVAVGPALRAEEPGSVQAGQEALRHDFARLIEDLDSDHYETRREAARRLEAICERKEAAPLLAAEIQRVLISTAVSFEVRQRLEHLRTRLPETPPAPAQEAAEEELDELVTQLGDDSYGSRLAARRRLEWLLTNPGLGGPIMLRLKRRLDDGELPLDLAQWLEPLYDRARGAWLSGEPDFAGFPPVEPEQIVRWVAELAQSPDTGTEAVNRRVEVAERELADALARDECVEPVKHALQQRLAQGDLDARSKDRLQKLIDLTQPAMVAEYWQDCRHVGSQHLLVDVPSLSEGASRPSHFDRIDERTANCVSGQNLLPGEYPVGVAIPHPRVDAAVFHLVNLPTPRRRMAYEYQTAYDKQLPGAESRRLAALSRRTFDRWLAEKHVITDKELRAFQTLDPAEISRFAAQYFRVVDDRPLPRLDDRYTTGAKTLHGAICDFLVRRGTRDVIDGLTEAIKQDRFLPLEPPSPAGLPWIAALAVAERDPWPGADTWLAGLLDRDEPLGSPNQVAPGDGDTPVSAPEQIQATLGATAAGLLLNRYHQDPQQAGLEAVDEPALEEVELIFYRFASPAASEHVRRWWTEQRQSLETEPAE